MFKNRLLSTLAAIAGALAFLRVPAPINAGTVSAPVFHIPAPKEPAKTYGAMPVDHAEVDAWNAKVRAKNIARGKRA